MVADGHGVVADEVHRAHDRVAAVPEGSGEGQRLGRRALDRVARVEQQRRIPVRPRRLDRGRDPGEPLSEILVRQRVVRMDAPVEVGGVEDRERDRGQRQRRRDEEDRDRHAPHRARIECARMARKPGETLEEKKRRAAAVLRRLKKAYPDAKCALDTKSPLELLVATILSAQCTDVRVNMVTPGLFAKYRTAADYARSPRGRARAGDPIRPASSTPRRRASAPPAPRSRPGMAGRFPTRWRSCWSFPASAARPPT